MKRIGDFFDRIGAMTEELVADILRIRSSDKEDDEVRLFGEIAIERGYVDDAALAKYVESKS